MASSRSKALWDSLSSDQKKEMAAIAPGRQADRQTEAADVPIKDVAEDEPPPPSSLVHAGMTIGDARAHYMYMVREEREEQFQEAQADQAYNLHLLDEHRQAKEQLAVGMVIAPDAFVAQQAALLDSYRSAYDIRWPRYTLLVPPTPMSCSSENFPVACSNPAQENRRTTPGNRLSSLRQTSRQLHKNPCR